MLEIVFIIHGILNSRARPSTKTTKIGSPRIKSISQYIVVCRHSAGTLISITSLHYFANKGDNGSLDMFINEKALYFHKIDLFLWNKTHILWINDLLQNICIILFYIDCFFVVCTALFCYLFEIKTATMMPFAWIRQLNAYAALRQWRNRIKSIVWDVLNRQVNRQEWWRNLAHWGSWETVLVKWKIITTK